MNQPLIAAVLIGVGLNAILPLSAVQVINIFAVIVWSTIAGQLLQAVLYDSLTGLPNRTCFLQKVEQAIQRSKRRQRYQYAVFLLDLDQFRSINETLGQTVGNRLLLALSNRLFASLPLMVTLARVGGNEFALLWDRLPSLDQTIQIANQLQALLATPFQIDGQELCVTVSIGVVHSSSSYTWAEDLLRDAQLATHHAKRLGRSRHVIFQPNLRAQPAPLRPLETDLWQSIDRQELRLHYQAIVSLETGKICGFEALVRWQHPQYGLLLPARFIPVAEASGMIALIDRWTLAEACRQLSFWQQRFLMEPPLHISVNLSSRQFVQPDLLNQVEHVLKDTQPAAGTLTLEITESIMMEDTDAAIATLEQMKALNVRLSIDDFGTGYSSLSYLYRFPTDTLKIDRSFISRIGNDCDNDAIVRTIVSLAHSLGMTVTAEGIETAAQLRLLRSLHCEYGQGYFFSKPLDCHAVEALLAIAPRW